MNPTDLAVITGALVGFAALAIGAMQFVPALRKRVTPTAIAAARPTVAGPALALVGVALLVISLGMFE